MSLGEQIAPVENWCWPRVLLIIGFFLDPSLALMLLSQGCFQAAGLAGFGGWWHPCAPTLPRGFEDWLEGLALALECCFLEVSLLITCH